MSTTLEPSSPDKEDVQHTYKAVRDQISERQHLVQLKLSTSSVKSLTNLMVYLDTMSRARAAAVAIRFTEKMVSNVHEGKKLYIAEQGEDGQPKNLTPVDLDFLLL